MRKYKGFWLAYVIVSLKEGACLLSLVIFSVREGTKERGGGRQREERETECASALSESGEEGARARGQGFHHSKRAPTVCSASRVKHHN